MELYYQNETLYIDLNEDLDEFTYRKLKHKIFRIIEDYGVDRIVLHSKHQIFTNRHFVIIISRRIFNSLGIEFFSFFILKLVV